MATIKIIEIEDKLEGRQFKYPYVLSIQSHIRFRLRSKKCLNHTPVILIQKLVTFQYLLPLQKPIDVNSPQAQERFTVLSGSLTKEGAWEADLCGHEPGVISFQLAFLDSNNTMIPEFGTHDAIILCQNKFDLRKLRSQTVFARCIGPATQWPAFFKRQMSLGYNAFHLAPIQKTGESNSYYSLKSHLELSDRLFVGTPEQKNKQLENTLAPLKQEGVAFIIDIVLNHISFDSEWVQTQPGAVYTTDNTPMLYTAFLVDEAIFEWGQQVKEMMADDDIQLTEQILSQIQTNLTDRLNNLQLYEYFQLESTIKSKMLELVPTRKPSENIFAKDPIESILDFFAEHCSTPNSNKNGVTVSDLNPWITLDLNYLESDLDIAIKTFNYNWKHKLQHDWIPEIIKNTIGEVRYHYMEAMTRKFGDLYPLVGTYFSPVQGPKHKFYALNNGWVGNHDSRELFVTSKEYYYLRRRVNVWGDLLRVRYGNKPSDSPAAWDHMLKYVQQMAKYFDGFRLDNLHGTPMYVARYLIREARKVNPNLIIFAELFTSSIEQSAQFVRQVGINSILKETQHLLNGDSAVHAFHHQIDRTSAYLGTLNRHFEQNGQKIKYAHHKKPITLLYDLTHDNETYPMKNMIHLQTPVAVLISFLGTFTGSTKGFDQFYSKKIDVTQLEPLYSQDVDYTPTVDKSEFRPYLFHYRGKADTDLVGSWNNWKQAHKMTFHAATNTYFTTIYLSPGQYEYKFRHSKEWVLEEGRPSNGSNHKIQVTQKMHPRIFYRNFETIRAQIHEMSEKYFPFREYHVFNIGDILIVFREPDNHLESITIIVNISKEATPLPSQIELQGNIQDCEVWHQSDFSVYQGLVTQTQIVHTKNLHEYFDIGASKSTGNDVLRAHQLPSGFACFIYCKKNSFYTENILAVEDILEREINLPKLGPLELNSLFFNCSQETEHLQGYGNYTIPQQNNKQLVYAGFAGVFQSVQRAKRTFNLNEGVFKNLREGNWLMDYYINRCSRYKHLAEFTQYLEKVFGIISLLPRYLIPKYFADFIYKLSVTVKGQFGKTTDFENSLVFACSQFINYFPSCPLPDKSLVAAGLPHFSVGWARCWGRDTFTASDILRIYPSIFRESIIQFASAMRHGLIPNLLDEGRSPRYNCRDACWWFIKGVADYIDETKDYEILKNKVEMLFLSSDKFQHNKLKAEGKKRIMLIEEIIHEIFQSHAKGISFREWNSGFEIDSNMTIEGFNINLEVDARTGFIIGGNKNNCLTWMDKMGSSVHAGTKGMPSTPRAGTPVQLVGLLYSCLRSFESLNARGYYSYNGVNYQGASISLGKWAEKITYCFDNQFFERQSADQEFVTGIYRDVINSPLEYQQKRFRPNALITLAVAPEICEPHHARLYIKKVEEHLLKPKSIGVGTLSDNHNFYCPYYDNSNDSSDPKVAHGFSYHNGPEWVWLYGFYLVAKMNFEGKVLSKRRIMSLLQEHIKHLRDSQWQSLTELTNRNGEYNHFSCPAQAWSISSILMAIRKMQSLPFDK